VVTSLQIVVPALKYGNLQRVVGQLLLNQPKQLLPE
jgi:hypothetical protein